MKQAKWFLLLHVILGIYAGSSVCSKLAAQQPFLSAAFIVLYGLMLLALVVYAVGWQQVIKHLPLTTAYANKAVTDMVNLYDLLVAASPEVREKALRN